MAFDFPSTPSNGASYTANGITFTFDGTVWKRETGAVKGQKGEVGAAGTLATAVVKKVRTATLSGTVYYTAVGSGNWTAACLLYTSDAADE